MNSQTTVTKGHIPQLDGIRGLAITIGDNISLLGKHSHLFIWMVWC